jgi:hypothetical protein
MVVVQNGNGDDKYGILYEMSLLLLLEKISDVDATRFVVGFRGLLKVEML